MRRDVLIAAPPALPFSTLPPLSQEDIAFALNAENRLLRREVEDLRVTASTIANVAICLAWLRDENGVTTIPRQLSDRMMGAGITLKENELGDVVVTISERTEKPVEIDP